MHVFIILQLQISSCSGSVRIRSCFSPSASESSSFPVVRILLRKLGVPFQKLQNRIRAQAAISAIWFSICLGVLDMRREMNAHCAFYRYNHMALGKSEHFHLTEMLAMVCVLVASIASSERMNSNVMQCCYAAMLA